MRHSENSNNNDKIKTAMTLLSGTQNVQDIASYIKPSINSTSYYYLLFFAAHAVTFVFDVRETLTGGC